jgi:membrane associated rhomboid family serine protease
MSGDNHFKFSPSVLAWPLYFVLLLWLVYWAEIKFSIDLTEYGIYPRTLSGMRGIVFSPFLHGSLEHIYNNSIPLFLLTAALRFFYRKQALEVIGYGILLSGFITWLIARPSYHIGASGLIYVLVSFIFFKGIQTQYYRLVALSMLIILLYGGMIWYVFPDVEEGISWEGHLAGLITGFLFTLIYKTPEYKKPIVYAWEQPDFDPQQDPFMKRFDANGNFVNPPKPEDIEVIDPEIVSPFAAIRIIYNYQPYSPNKQEGTNDASV